MSRVPVLCWTAPAPRNRQALEQGVIQDVQQGAGESQQRHDGQAIGQPQESHTQSERNDPDVLDTMVSQQPLEVVLSQREEHAEDAGHDTDRHQRPTPPRRHVAEKRQRAQEPVNARLDHHAAHHGRHVRGRGGMRLRQPDVHGNETGLRAETDDGQHEQHAGQAAFAGELRRSPTTRMIDPAAGTAPAGTLCPGASPPDRSSRRAGQLACSWSVSTRKNDASDMPSQHIEEEQAVARRHDQHHRHGQQIEEEPRPADRRRLTRNPASTAHHRAQRHATTTAIGSRNTADNGSTASAKLAKGHLPRQRSPTLPSRIRGLGRRSPVPAHFRPWPNRHPSAASQTRGLLTQQRQDRSGGQHHQSGSKQPHVRYFLRGRR